MGKKREIIVGTSGYSFDDWRGVFYPDDIPRKHWLPFYARQFSSLEINSTYYAIPRSGILKRMADITPERFQFVVKLPGEITHKRDGDFSPFRQFTERIDEILQAGKLSGLLAQFPFSFKRDGDSDEYIRFMRENLPSDIPLFVEFRHKSWDTEEAVKFVDYLGLGWVSPDEPDIPELMSRRVMATGDTGYVRLHSRDKGKWWSNGGRLRYDYDYDCAELGEIIGRIDALPATITRVFVFFNNCHGGSAVRNALAMKEMLGQNIFPEGGQIGLL